MALTNALRESALAVFREATKMTKAQAKARREAAIRRIEREMAALLRRQRDLYLKGLPKIASHFLTTEVKEAAYDLILDEIEAEVFTATRTESARIIANALREAKLFGYQDLAREMGIEASFTMGSPKAIAWAQKNVGARVTQISETTRTGIRDIVTNGLKTGKDYGSVAREIRGAGIFSVDRAQVIAVNENAMAYENGSYDLVKDIEATGITMEKSWSTVGGDACEEICLPNEAQQWIPTGENFQSGDPFPPGHPRCRCAGLYQVSES
jgi:hypothetical protein